MSDGANYMKYVVIGVAVLGIGFVAWRNIGPSGEPGRSVQIVARRQHLFCRVLSCLPPF